MLTPRQLKNYSFTSAGRNSYRASEVDAYMEEVTRSYEQMFHENAEMVKKLNLLADRLAKFRADEDNIREALMEAQRMKNSIIAEAEEEAKKQLSATKQKIEETRDSIDIKTGEILAKAQDEADRIVAEANAQAAEIDKKAQADAEKKLKGAQKVSADMLKSAQDEYDKCVGSIAEQAETERLYLEKLQEQSIALRKELLNTYTMQIELLQAGPDLTKEDILSKFSKEDILTRPTVDSVYTDEDLAEAIDYPAYAAVETAEEDEDGEETPADVESVKEEAAAAVGKQTSSFTENLNELLKEAEEAVRSTSGAYDEDDADDEDDEELLSHMSEYLAEESEEEEPAAPEASDEETEEEDPDTYHYFDSEDHED